MKVLRKNKKQQRRSMLTDHQLKMVYGGFTPQPDPPGMSGPDDVRDPASIIGTLIGGVSAR